MSDKARKYVLYAIGEIALVMIGILLALQVNNWNQKQALKAQEKIYLELIKDDLLLQKEENNLQKNTVIGHSSIEEELIGYIVNRFQVSKDQRGQAKRILSTLLVGRTYGSYEATFLDLTSSGNIGIISDQSLKNQIIQHYQIQRRDRDVINNNTLNTYRELWTKLLDRNLILIAPNLVDYVMQEKVLEFNSSLDFLDDTLFENLGKDENLLLLQNVLSFKLSSTGIAVRFIDESNRRIDRLIEEIESKI